MKREIETKSFTKEVYLEVAADKATQIAITKQARNEKIEEIQGRIESLKSLRRDLNELKQRIKNEEDLLSLNRGEKIELTRRLRIQNRLSKRLSKSFIRGDESIQISKFYPENGPKTR